MPREWPNFLEKNLHAQIKAARLRSSLEHPEMHKHADDYARFLHLPFSLHHDLAAQALLKIHDAGRGRKPLEAIAEAYGQRLAEYRKTKSIALRNFLYRVKEELQARKINVEPPEPEEKVDPLSIIQKAVNRENTVEEKLRELLRIPHPEGKTYGYHVQRVGEEKKAALLTRALFRHIGTGAEQEKGEGLFVPPVEAERTRKILTQAGFNITSEKQEKNWHLFKIKPSQTVLKFLRTYAETRR